MMLDISWLSLHGSLHIHPSNQCTFFIYSLECFVKHQQEDEECKKRREALYTMNVSEEDVT